MVEPSKGNTPGTLHPKGASTPRRRIAMLARRSQSDPAGQRGRPPSSEGWPVRIYLMRSRMRETRTSGSVRGEGGNPLAYSTPGCAGRDEARGRGTWGWIMRNKAKLGSDGTPGGWRASEGPIMQNEPNLPIRAQAGTGRRTSAAAPSRALIAPNKPNSRRSKKKGKGLVGKDLW
jgi:hypothetical protein